MKMSNVLVTVVALSAALMCACGQDTTGGWDGGSGGAVGKGGSGAASISSGGNIGGATTALGGTIGSAGRSGGGGSSATGGSRAGGGSSGTGGGDGGSASGGTQAIGGSVASGGNAGGSGGGAGGSGGRATGGSAGRATGGATGVGGSAVGGDEGSGGTDGSGGTGNSGGRTGAGGSAVGGTGEGGTAAGGSTGGLPPLTVNGTELRANGKKVVLRGSSLIDIGALYAYSNNSAAGITTRMDKLATAGVQGHVVRLPAYPKIDYNGGYPYCSPLPYPVGTGPGTSCTPTAPMNASDYVSKVLKPAVDYATSKNLYVIIDHHQIDNVASGTSLADAKTFWSDVAPKFASYANVIYEPFNEPIDSNVTWATFKPAIQGLIDTIRASAKDNVIIVPSMSYCQRPGDAASDPPNGTNLMYTAHIYPGNWNSTFQTQVTTAAGKAPVFITEWGYILNSGDQVVGTSVATWGTDFEAFVDNLGASWTAWVTDNAWTPNMFSDSALTSLTDFGTVTKSWLAKKATSDWVQ